MKKFLNRTVAAIAAGCFLMPSAECVTGGKSCADGKNTGTETCSELEPERKIRRTRSFPDLSDVSVQREIEKIFQAIPIIKFKKFWRIGHRL